MAERFELHIGGLELCNGFSELTDPVEQRRAVKCYPSSLNNNKKETCPLPEKFLDALKDMPPAAGNALGLDRLVMLFADTNRIDDIVSLMTPQNYRRILYSP